MVVFLYTTRRNQRGNMQSTSPAFSSSSRSSEKGDSICKRLLSDCLRSMIFSASLFVCIQHVYIALFLRYCCTTNHILHLTSPVLYTALVLSVLFVYLFLYTVCNVFALPLSYVSRTGNFKLPLEGKQCMHGAK